MSEKFNRITFSVEFLSPRDLLEKKAVNILAKTDTYCALRILPNDLLKDDLKLLLERFKELNIEDHFIPWPLLDVEDGYYPNEISVDKFREVIINLLEWYKANGFNMPTGVVIDLEPPTDPKEAKKVEKMRELRLKATSKRAKKKIWKRQKKKGSLGKLQTINNLINTVKTNINPTRFEESIPKFEEIQKIMHDYGTKAIAVALPLAYEDQFDGKSLIQDFMTVPISGVDWDMINYMIFNTDYVSTSKGIISHEDYQHLIYVYGKEFVEKFGAERGSITLGITNVGVTDIRAVQTDPKLYRMEASALLAAGVKELGIYALDGILEQKDPIKWIETVKSAKASNFKINPEKIKFAGEVRRIFQAIDFLAPTLKYLVDSGRYKKIIQMAIMGKL